MHDNEVICHYQLSSILYFINCCNYQWFVKKVLTLRLGRRRITFSIYNCKINFCTANYLVSRIILISNNLNIEYTSNWENNLCLIVLDKFEYSSKAKWFRFSEKINKRKFSKRFNRPESTVVSRWSDLRKQRQIYLCTRHILPSRNYLVLRKSTSFSHFWLFCYVSHSSDGAW